MKKNSDNPGAIRKPQKMKPDELTTGWGKFTGVFLPYIIISIVVFGVYFQTLSYGFINFDDEVLMKNSLANVDDVSSIKEVFYKDASLSHDIPYYRPLLTLSFIINKITTGDNLFYYHLTSLIFHVILSCLLFAFLRLAKIADPLSLLVSLIFGVHPLFVNTVVWLAARADILVSVFLMASLIMLAKYEETKKMHYLPFHLLFFISALLSKEVALVAPLPFFSYLTRFKIGGLFKKENWPPLLSWILILVPFMIIRSSIVTGRQEMVRLSNFITNLPLVPEILCKFTIPFDLSGLPTYNYVLVCIGLILLLGIGIVLFKNKKEGNHYCLLFGFLWMAVFSLPAMFIRMPGTGVFDYLECRAYLPMIGMAVFLGSVFDPLFLRKRNLYYVLILIPIIFGVNTLFYSRTYSQPLSFYDSIVAKGTKVALAYNNRVRLKDEMGDKKSALEDAEKAIELKGDFAEAYSNRGRIRDEMGDKKGAMEDYDRAIKIKPNLAEAYINRGKIRYVTGDKEGAKQDLDRAIEIKRNYAEGYNARGLIKRELLDTDGAMMDYSRAIEIRPNYADAYFNRGNIRTQLLDKQGAMQDLSKAIEIKPNFAEAYFNRGNLRGELQDKQGAMLDLGKAIEIKPDFKEAYFNRGDIKRDLLDVQGAILDYSRFIELDPSYAFAHNSLGVCYLSLKEYEKSISCFEQAIKLKPDFAEAMENLETAKRVLNKK
jgi:tetratricopeptide (TPR) repeat protein